MEVKMKESEAGIVRGLYYKKFGEYPPLYEMNVKSDEEYVKVVKKAIKDNKPISNVPEEGEY